MNFWSQDLAFLFFCEIVQLGNIKSANLKHNIFLKVLTHKYPNQAFLVPNLSIFLYFAKFYNQTNLSVLISKMTIQFFKDSNPKVAKQRIFGFRFRKFHILAKILSFDKLECVDCKIDKIGFLKSLTQKHQNQKFLV